MLVDAASSRAENARGRVFRAAGAEFKGAFYLASWPPRKRCAYHA